MSLQCNIDARGKRVRFIGGSVITLIGVLLLVFWTIPVGGWLAWAVSLFLLLCGGFMLFEARAGWCAVRAMGFKTKI